MPKKYEDSPDGMICRKCGADKPPYNYFNPRNKFNTEFFVNPPDGKTCFDCGGDYKCITCGEVKPASEYRCQGRICKGCKHSLSRTKTRANGHSRVNRRKAEKEPLWEGFDS